MSKFRQLVEDIIGQTEHNHLTTEQHALLDNLIRRATEEVDVSELSSAYYDDNPFDVEPQLKGGSGEWQYDEDELWDEGCRIAIDWLESDGAAQYLWDTLTPEQQDNEEFNNALTKEAIEYVNNQISR